MFVVCSVFVLQIRFMLGDVRYLRQNVYPVYIRFVLYICPECVRCSSVLIPVNLSSVAFGA